MKKILFDYDKNVVYEKQVNKVRAIVINNEGKCLVTKCAGLYMLPGGKIDNGETDIEALKREIQEESGIQINENEAEIYLEIESYNRNYYDRKEKRDIDRITNTKFYIVETVDDINESNKKLTESEKEGKQTIEFMNLSVLRYLIEINKTDNKKKQIFDREILTALKEFEKMRTEKIEEKER